MQPLRVLQTSMAVTQCPLAARTGPKVGSPRDARWATTVRVRTTEMDAAWSVQRPVREPAATADHVRTQRLAQWRTAADQLRVQQGVRNTTRRVRICSPTEIRKDMATLHRMMLLVETRDRTVTTVTAGMGVVAGTSPTAETKGTGVTKSQSIAPPFSRSLREGGFFISSQHSLWRFAVLDSIAASALNECSPAFEI